MVKSELLSMAIEKRIKVRFYYGLLEVVIDPYFILFEEDGTKAIYGMSSEDGSLLKFHCKRIANIRLLPEAHFTPIIPVSPSYN